MQVASTSNGITSRIRTSRNGDTYPGGMVGAIVYEDAMDSAIFADLMDYAGYEG